MLCVSCYRKFNFLTKYFDIFTNNSSLLKLIYINVQSKDLLLILLVLVIIYMCVRDFYEVLLWLS